MMYGLVIEPRPTQGVGRGRDKRHSLRRVVFVQTWG